RHQHCRRHPPGAEQQPEQRHEGPLPLRGLHSHMSAPMRASEIVTQPPKCAAPIRKGGTFFVPMCATIACGASERNVTEWNVRKNSAITFTASTTGWHAKSSRNDVYASGPRAIARTSMSRKITNQSTNTLL